MADLTALNPSLTYDNLLQINNPDNAGLSSTIVRVQDGVGQNSPLAMSYRVIKLTNGSTLTAQTGSIVDFSDAASVITKVDTSTNLVGVTMTVTNDVTVGGEIIGNATPSYLYSGTVSVAPTSAGEDNITIGDGSDGGDGNDNIIIGHGITAAVVNLPADNSSDIIMLGRPNGSQDPQMEAISFVPGTIKDPTIRIIEFGHTKSKLRLGDFNTQYSQFDNNVQIGQVDTYTNSTGLSVMVTTGASSMTANSAVGIGHNVDILGSGSDNSVGIGINLTINSDELVRVGKQTAAQRYLEYKESRFGPQPAAASGTNREDQIVFNNYVFNEISFLLPTKGAMAYITDEAGGAQPAFSDGTTWRRFTDRAVIST